MKKVCVGLRYGATFFIWKVHGPVRAAPGVGKMSTIKKKVRNEMSIGRKEQILDVVKDFLSWIVVSVAAFVWWMAMLLILSMVLMNVLNFSFIGILRVSIVLASICSAAYLIRIIYRRFSAKNI